MSEHPAKTKRWTFLTSHGHALLLVARDPRARIRDIAEALGMTERATHAVLRDLVSDGYLEVTKEGRRNVYHVRASRPLRHPLFQHNRVADLIKALSAADASPE